LPACLIEAVVVPHIVQHVAGVEQVGDGRIQVVRRRPGAECRENRSESAAPIRCCSR
jgi:hypothetical protein